MAEIPGDLDSIANILEEKQNDLELAAKIGKTLLDKNRDLERRLTELEQKLAAKEDLVDQLRHNLSVKDTLLQIYTCDHPEVSYGDPSAISSEGFSQGGQTSDDAESLYLTSINFACLSRKIQELEEENLALREERARLTTAADQLDEHEGILIRDCARQLITANSHIRTLSEELAKKADAHLTQQSEITRLFTRGLDLQNQVEQLTTEKELLTSRLGESQSAQLRLSNELCHLRDRYDECLSLFRQARAEIRALRKRFRRANLRSSFPPSRHLILNAFEPLVNPEAAEGSLTDESTSSDNETANLQADSSLASDLATTSLNKHAAKNCTRLLHAMEQVRAVQHPSPIAMEHGIDAIVANDAPDDAISSSGFISGSDALDEAFKSEMIGSYSSFTTHMTACNTTMEDSIKRHSWMGPQSRNISTPVADVVPRAIVNDNPLTSNLSELCCYSCPKLPQKLQLIKSLEGSDVLQHWQRLATPSFSRALFEDPPRLVQNRAGIACTSSSRLDNYRAIHVLSEASKVRPSFPSRHDRGSPVYACAPSMQSPGISSEHSLSPISFLRGVWCENFVFYRFGLNLPGQLMGSGIRSRSLENVRHNFRPIVGSSDSRFSITNLMKALLPPFSSTHRTVPSRDSQLAYRMTRAPHTATGSVHPDASQGLLEVGVIEKPCSPVSLQRIPAVVAQSGPCRLPRIQSPDPSPPVHTLRTTFSKNSRNVNLTGINEEALPETVVKKNSTLADDSHHR